jgi:hypothetical protein
MYEITKMGNKTIDILKKDLEERKISMLFSTLALSTIPNHYNFLKIIDNYKLDGKTKEKLSYESLYFHIRKVISSKVILEEVKGVTKDSSSLITKKLREELERFSLRNKWSIEESIEEYKESIQDGRSDNLDFSITLILKRTGEKEEKRVYFKKKLKDSFNANETSTLKEVQSGIENRNLDDLMLFLGTTVINEGSVIEREQLKIKCDNISAEQAKVLTNEQKTGKISEALRSILIQGLLISVGYREMIEIKKIEKDELEKAIFEIAFFHTRLLIRNKEVSTKLGEYVPKREIKKELLSELDNLAVRIGRSMKEPMKGFRDASKKERSIGEKDYITSRALTLWKQEEKMREIFELHLKNEQMNSLEKIEEMLSKFENIVMEKGELEGLLFRKLE